jgi:flagellar hook-length control protein FliK
MLEQMLDETPSKITHHDQPKQTNQLAHNVSAAAFKAQTTGASTFINTLNLYEAQFTSRVGMLLADQMARGNENFEFQLEPESFGKVRVNVALENSNVEIKMVVDNTAAVMALRGGENMLQVLAEQHGLKLSEYVVDLQNNQNGKSSDQDKNFQENEKDGLKNAEDFEQEIEITNPDSRYNLNLLA